MSDIRLSGSSVHALDANQLMKGLKHQVNDKNEGTIVLRKGGKVPTAPKDVQNEGQQKLPKDNVHLRRFKSVAVGALAALRCLGAIGTLGLSELAVRGIRTAVRDHGTQRTANMSIQVTIPGKDGPVTLSGAILPKRIPKDMTVDQLQAKIQQKINDGHELLKNVGNGSHTDPCTTKDMTNIMFFLKATAQGHGDTFSEGAFSIPDPGCKIRQFLDSCPQAFQRESSHIGEFQGQDGGRHRGIDVHGKSHDIDQCLPDHNKTLLYGSMQKNENLNMSEDRLFLKMETFGAFLTSPKGGGDVGGPNNRSANYHDASAILGHSLSFIATRGQGSAAGTRKERIPDTVKNKFNDIVGAAPENLKGILGQNNPLATSGGIKVMLANIAQARAGTTDEALLTKMTAFENYINSTYRHTTDRIGNEVMLSKEEMGL